MGIIEYGKVADFCREHWSEEIEKTLNIADLAIENRFIFNMPWDMERTQTEVAFPQEINWWLIMNDDKEFLFQFNRHRFLIALGQAYQLSGEDKYVQGFVRLLMDWITRVKRDNGADSPWRSLEVGIRGEVWTQAMRYVEHSPIVTEEVKTAYRECLKVHAEVLREKHSPFQKGSNWGVIQDCGLLSIAIELENEEDINLALTRLVEQAELQIMSDGMHWEQSCTYHNEILLRYMNAARVLQATGRALPDNLAKKIEKMLEVNIAWIKPDGRQPLFGDSDNNELFDLFSQAALVTGRADLKAYGFPVLDYESAWLFGVDGITRYNEMPVGHKSINNAFLEDSGSYILRSGKEDAINYLCMHNGYTGGGHAHADKLHFDLSLGSEDVLVDAGRYTYVINKTRKYFKGAQAHNTTTVGRRGFLNMHGWGFWDSALSIQYPCFDDDNCSLIGGAHLGYARFFGGVFTERQILFIKPDIYIVIDGFRTRCPHSYRQYFHFNPDGNVDIEKNIATYKSKNVTAKLHFLTNHASVKKIKSEFSPHYNNKCDNDAVKVKFSGFMDRYGLTVIHGAKNDEFVNYEIKKVKAVAILNNIPLPDFYASGIVIKTPSAEYTVCIAHKELKTTFECNGKIATGRLTVFRNDERIFTRW